MNLFDTLQATWPPAATEIIGSWQICDGRNGGQRVSAARAVSDVTTKDIPQAEDAMRALKQTPLFMIRPGEDALDTTLKARGYVKWDPTLLMHGPIAPHLKFEIPRVTAFSIWPPLQIMREIWLDAGVTKGRFDVMDRAPEPKIGIFGRVNDRPAGAGFAAVSEGVVMVHALEIDPKHRRNGLGGHMMRAAAQWGAQHGADHIALAVLRANTGAIAFYHSLGMVEQGSYHYRKAPNP